MFGDVVVEGLGEKTANLERVEDSRREGRSMTHRPRAPKYFCSLSVHVTEKSDDEVRMEENLWIDELTSWLGRR